MSRARAATAAVLALAVAVLSSPQSALADGDPMAPPPPPPVGTFTGMPPQSFLDGAAGSENSSSGGTWADMAGGVSARPYVTSLALINDGVSTPVFTGAGVTPPATGEGGITATVAPVNLCKAGEAPSPGRCYATPNRVAITLTHVDGMNLSYDFSHPTTPLTPRVDADTVVDMTVALNTLGSSLRWTWVSGQLLFWQTSNLGAANASLHLRFHPTVSPLVSSYPADNGCSATPIFNCHIAQADADVLSASLLLSLDTTLDPVLTGAVFATQHAMLGFLSPRGAPAAPQLDFQVASTHTAADGSAQLGSLQALLPSAALLSLYGLTPADAAPLFTTTRAGDPGTNSAPTYAPWTPAANGSDGLMVTVRDITFSAPTYRVKARLAPAVAVGIRTRAGTAISVKGAGCTALRPCAVSVYDLGLPHAARPASAAPLLRATALLKATAVVHVPAAKLAKGHRFAVVVRNTRTHRAVSTARGVVR